MTPQRIQLSRKKGFRLPPNTVVVARPSRWGNPFRVRPADCQAGFYAVLTKSEAVAEFRRALRVIDAGGFLMTNTNLGWEISTEDIRRELRGKNLACWCPLDGPCHADVLLKIANVDYARRQSARRRTLFPIPARELHERRACLARTMRLGGDSFYAIRQLLNLRGPEEARRLVAAGDRLTIKHAESAKI